MVTRLLSWIALVLNAAGTVLILILSVLMNADIIGRGVFSHPLNGVNEFASMAIVAIVFLQITDATAANRLTRSDMVLLMIQKRAPRAAQTLEALFDLGGAVLFAVLANAVWPLLVQAFQEGEFMGVEGIATFPTWPLDAIVVLSSFLLVLHFALKVIADVRGIVRPAAAVAIQPQEHAV
ncbi:TRAP transporter small permease subunit [Xanthobacter sp. KR7-225]|uniref:TRAP transporter small permease subunit n=1 Tax=Xanthobacter sp. KR7-225 TaxID=3156613 RepID=UPI0032B4BAF6